MRRSLRRRIVRACVGVVAAGATAAVPAGADAPAPDTSITDAPPSRTAANAASIAFASDTAGVTFTCSLDFATPFRCTSPYTFTNLTDGLHTLLVAAAGDDTPAQTRVTVDTVAPDTILTSAVPAATNAPTITLEFAASESGKTLCALDGAAPAPCISPLTLMNLAPGPHSFSVAAADLVDNLDGTPAAASWTIEPVALIGAGRVRATANGRITVTVGPLVQAAQLHVGVRRGTASAAAARQVKAPAGTPTRVVIPLAMATRRALARHRRLALKVAVTLDSGAKATRTLTVLAPPRKAARSRHE